MADQPDAMTDAEAAERFGKGWRSVDTMPSGIDVMVLTVRGLIRLARRRPVRLPRRADDWGPRRIACMSRHADHGGDLAAVAWRPQETGDA
jgi:hypothetical protein